MKLTNSNHRAALLCLACAVLVSHSSAQLLKSGGLGGGGSRLGGGTSTTTKVNNTSVLVSQPGSNGDPHFRTWTGDKYDFHGECDLVLLQNPHFANDLGMDIHLRTRIEDRWSHIERAAIRIGMDTLEVKGGDVNETVWWINGVDGEGKDLPPSFAGYPILYYDEHRPNSLMRVYTIDLGRGEGVMFKTFKKFVDVRIRSGSEDNFAFSLGLMGSFESGEKIARDGMTIIEDPNQFGFEWQVRDDEPKLFHTFSLEYPQVCKMPSTKSTERRLGGVTLEQAERACAPVNEAERDHCIFDVMATDDVDMAGAY